MLLIGGGVTVLIPLPVQQQLFSFEIPAMVALTLLLWIVFKISKRVSRWEGLGLLMLYLGIVVWAVYGGFAPEAS